jgi:hypothetical protein
MFQPGDPLAEALGWGAIELETADTYETNLASFLGDLACGEGTTVHVARRLADGILGAGYWAPVPLSSSKLATRLIDDDCPPAVALSGDVRRQLKELAERSGTQDEGAAQ